jgi:hypothetical protein
LHVFHPLLAQPLDVIRGPAKVGAEETAARLEDPDGFVDRLESTVRLGMLWIARLLTTTSKESSAKGSERMSAVSSSTRPATPSTSAFLRVVSGLLPD